VSVDEVVDPQDHSADAVARRARELRPLWREAVALLPDVGRLVRALARDPRTSWRTRAIAALVAAYVASPVDLLPDVIPGVGGVDDVLLALWALRRLVASAGYELIREHWTGTDDGFALLIVLAGVDR
jgi:uncharacterized membrane protein YkvA (DUF1232 family)